MGQPVSARHELLAAVVICTAVALVFLKVELLDNTASVNAAVAGDLLGYFYGNFTYGFAQLREGHLPLWNPHQSCGAPFIASLHQGFFYPFYLPFLFLDAGTAYNVHIVLDLVLAALGVYLLCRHFGIPWAPAVIAGLVYAYHGRMMIWVYFPAALNSCTAVPYLVLLVDMLLTRPTWRACGLLAVVLGLSFLGGHGLQFHYFMMLIVVPLAVIRSVQRVRCHGWQSLRRPYALVLLGAVLGVLVGLVRTLPFGEFVAQSWRAPGKLGQWTAMMPVAPSIFREGLLTPAPGTERSRFHPRSADKLRTVYVGIVPLMLASLGVILWRRRALAYCFGAIAVFAALYSFGTHGFVFPLIARLPGGDWFQGVDRVLNILGLTVAVLGGAGLAEVIRGRDAAAGTATSSPRAHRLILIIAVVAAVAAAAMSFGAPRGRLLVAIYSGLTITLLSLLLFGPRRKAAQTVIVTALAVLVVFDLFHAQVHSGPLPSQLGQYFSRHDRLYALIRERQGFDRTYVYGSFQGNDPLYFFGDTAKAGMLHGLWLPTDYDPVCGLRFATYMERLGPTLLYHQGYTFFVLTPQNIQLVNLMGVRFFMLSEEGEKTVLSKYPEMAQQWSLMASENGVKVYEYGGALPRAFVVGRVEVVADGDEVLERLATADLRAVAFVEEPLGAPLSVGAVDAGESRAEITAYAPNAVTVETSGGGGMMVLTDQYDDGWRVSVDGARVPLYRTNYLFRGVPVPPGRHRVDFVYRPMSFVIGALGTLLGLVGVLALLRAPN